MIRQDFENYIELLHEHGIEKLYHVTSRDNWESIRKHGLYPANMMKQRGIENYHSYSNIVTRRCDESVGLNNYIHLTFSSNPIFLEAGIKSGEIDSDYIILEISLDILKDADTEFVNMNPHNGEATRGNSFKALEAVHFTAAASSDRVGIKQKQRKYCQAEVLAPSNIAPEMILNKQEIDNQIYESRLGDRFKRRAVVILIDQSTTMGTHYIMGGKEFPSVSSAVQNFVNRFLTNIAKSFHFDGDVNKYDIAVLGSTDGEIVQLWNNNNFGPVYYGRNTESPFLSSEDLFNIYVSNLCSDTIEWVTVGYDSWSSRTVDALTSIHQYLQSWINENSSNNHPPVVVYITEGDHIKYDAQAFVKICGEIRKLQTRLGNTMLWQLEYTPYHSDNLILPTDIDIQGLDPTGNFMYRQASELSDIHLDKIEEISSTKGTSATHKAMAVNLDINKLSSLILEC